MSELKVDEDGPMTKWNEEVDSMQVCIDRFVIAGLVICTVKIC